MQAEGDVQLTHHHHSHHPHEGHQSLSSVNNETTELMTIFCHFYTIHWNIHILLFLMIEKVCSFTNQDVLLRGTKLEKKLEERSLKDLSSSKNFIRKSWFTNNGSDYFKASTSEKIRWKTRYHVQKSFSSHKTSAREGNKSRYISTLLILESAQPFLAIIPVLKKRSQLFLAGVRAASGAGVLLEKYVFLKFFLLLFTC